MRAGLHLRTAPILIGLTLPTRMYVFQAHLSPVSDRLHLSETQP